MLQLNPANALVVGGRIKEWEEVAKRQREKMAKIKGMGVDATVKALIWNPDGVEEGELISFIVEMADCYFYLLI